MKQTFSFEELLHKPLCMMSGQEFAFFVSNLSLLDKEEGKVEEVRQAKRCVYGISGIAELFSCSIPTANRIKRSGIIDKAISQVGRKIVVDADLALELVNKHNHGL